MKINECGNWEVAILFTWTDSSEILEPKVCLKGIGQRSPEG